MPSIGGVWTVLCGMGFMCGLDCGTAVDLKGESVRCVLCAVCRVPYGVRVSVSLRLETNAAV